MSIGSLENIVHVPTTIFISPQHMFSELLNNQIPLTLTRSCVRCCECGHLIACVRLSDMKPFELCQKHGIEGYGCFITKDSVFGGKLIMQHEQILSPSHFYDRQVVLPEFLSNQFSKLFNSFGFFLSCTIHNTEEGTQERVYPLRECILYGGFTFNNYAVMVWSLRPTLNFMDAVCNMRSHEEHTLTNNVFNTASKASKTPLGKVNIALGSTEERTGVRKVTVTG